jgi:hypothetical protein
VPPLLVCHHAQQLQRVGVVRVGAQNALIDRFRLVQTTGAVQGDRVLELRRRTVVLQAKLRSVQLTRSCAKV